MADDWLEAPDQREVRRYHRDPASGWYVQWVFIDHGLPIPGEPALLKRRRLRDFGSQPMGSSHLASRSVVWAGGHIGNGE